MGKFNQNKAITVAITTNGTAKDAGDVVGGLLTVPVSSPQNGFTLRELKLVDDANQAAALTVYVFDAAPTSIADDAAFASAFVIGDHQKVRRVIPIATGDWTAINSNAHVLVPNVNLDILSQNGNLYLYIVCTATPTYGAADLTLHLYGWED